MAGEASPARPVLLSEVRCGHSLIPTKLQIDRVAQLVLDCVFTLNLAEHIRKATRL